MENENSNKQVDESRRKFLEKAGKAGVAAPAAAILLAGGVKTAQADPYGSNNPPTPPCSSCV